MLGAEPGQVKYWRDRAGHEVDFVVPRGRGECDAIECKWNPDEFEAKPFHVFRSFHPHGRNYLVSPNVVRTYSRTSGSLEVLVCTSEQLLGLVAPDG